MLREVNDDVICVDALDVLVELDEHLEVDVLDDNDILQIVNILVLDEEGVLHPYDINIDDYKPMSTLDELDENDCIDIDDEVGVVDVSPLVRVLLRV